MTIQKLLSQPAAKEGPGWDVEHYREPRPSDILACYDYHCNITRVTFMPHIFLTSQILLVYAEAYYFVGIKGPGSLEAS